MFETLVCFMVFWGSQLSGLTDCPDINLDIHPPAPEILPSDPDPELVRCFQRRWEEFTTKWIGAIENLEDEICEECWDPQTQSFDFQCVFATASPYEVELEILYDRYLYSIQLCYEACGCN